MLLSKTVKCHKNIAQKTLYKCFEENKTKMHNLKLSNKSVTAIIVLFKCYVVYKHIRDVLTYRVQREWPTLVVDSLKTHMISCTKYGW